MDEWKKEKDICMVNLAVHLGIEEKKIFEWMLCYVRIPSHKKQRAIAAAEEEVVVSV